MIQRTKSTKVLAVGTNEPQMYKNQQKKKLVFIFGKVRLNEEAALI